MKDFKNQKTGMKKFLPLIILILGIGVLITVFFVNKSKNTSENSFTQEEKALIDVPLEKRPVVSLTPTSDGHYLKLKIEKLNLFNAVSLDYKLEYKVPGNPDQGVPGMVKLTGKDIFEADLLLGSESSGKYRYDEGVEQGSITLSYRNADGKLLARFKSDFHLQSDVGELTSLDGKFNYTLDKTQKGVFYITMPTIGNPDSSFTAVISKDGYAVFASI
ncbi:hypothetical protein A2159_01510 [Candidatus Woesebacteria bacterium RBG_13_34_9]|uniref:Uncharacterized protein n=1 Tax=Candidatus Woesebacteria bacterium RBG_13_34_9 TaxID=1802477 RepID=A0A1F7X1S1_9BACT|nr:MAG: hypothetical protein A2159_01510 [Candidatus Woesebacteria bacterium RBG_13_34_9]